MVTEQRILLLPLGTMYICGREYGWMLVLHNPWTPIQKLESELQQQIHNDWVPTVYSTVADISLVNNRCSKRPQIQPIGNLDFYNDSSWFCCHQCPVTQKRGARTSFDDCELDCPLFFQCCYSGRTGPVPALQQRSPEHPQELFPGLVVATLRSLRHY